MNEEVKSISKKIIRNNMPEPKMVDASFCNDLPNEFYSWAWSDFKIPSGSMSISKWILDNSFVKCSKKDASCLLVVGNKNEDGLWLKGVKYIWLKPA